MRMKRARLILATLSIAALIPGMASAASYGGVGGKPAYPVANNPRTKSIFIFELKPGQSASSGVQVFNNTNTTQTINLYGVDSVVSSGGAFACAQNNDPKKEVGAWIHLDQNSVTLSPNSNKIVPFTVTVPNNKSVSVGEHDGCIAMQAASQTATNTKFSAADGRHGIKHS